MFKIYIFLVFLAFSFKESYGLRCYTCSVTEDEADTTCDTDPEGLGTLGITDCDKKYCTIVRIDYKDPKGKLASLSRSCMDIPIYINDVIEDETHRAYYRSCKEDLCNSGSGKAETSNTNRALGDKSTIYCPGIGKDAALVNTVSMVVVLLCFVVIKIV